MLNGGEDILVRSATADIAAHIFLNVGVRGAAWLFKQCDGRHDLAGGAVSALVPIMSDKGGLHRMQCARRAQALDGGDFFAVVHQRQAEARVHAPAIDMHRAGAALTVIAAFLCAGEGDGLANTIQQRRARIDSKVVVFAVNPQRDWDSSLNRRTAGYYRVRLVRVKWSASRNDGGCRTTSHRQEKFPAARI